MRQLFFFFSFFACIKFGFVYLFFLDFVYIALQSKQI